MRQRLTTFQWIVFVYALVSIFFVFQLGLTEQEAYYWLWAKNPDWSYFDHPPLQAWVTAILTFLFGDEKWVVRLPAFLGDMTLLILFYHWTKHKWDKKTAEVCSLLLMSSCVFMMGSVIALPDSLAVPLGLGAIFCAQKGFVKRSAIFLGLALLGKWTVLFIVPGIAYAFYRQNKFRLSNVFYFGIIVFALQSPVIWWNIRHANVTAKFHLYGRHAHELLPPSAYAENIMNFFLAQFFSLGLMTSALLIYFGAQRRPLQTLNKTQWKSLFFWSFPGLAIVFISAAQGQIRFYWTFLSLLPAVACLGYVTVQKFPNALLKLRVGIVLVAIFQWSCGWLAGFYPIGSSIENFFHLKSDLRRTPMGELNGWSQWYRETVLPSGLLDDETALLGSDLHVAARLSWTVRKERSLASIGVVGLSKNQFQFWLQPQPPRYRKAIFFGDNRYDHLDHLEEVCADKVEWKIAPSKAYNRTIKNVYWTYCGSLRAPGTVSN